ncbi:hypothetical protein GN956_G16065 [Arapaima gigas]
MHCYRVLAVGSPHSAGGREAQDAHRAQELRQADRAEMRSQQDVASRRAALLVDGPPLPVGPSPRLKGPQELLLGLRKAKEDTLLELP